MPLVRGHHSFDDQFTQVPNSWLRDTNLSLGAKGLLAQILSHKEGWEISQQSLADANRIGKDAIRTLIRELLSAGYLNRSEDRTRLEKGYLGGYVYTTQDPHLASPTLPRPRLDNPPHKNTITKEEHVKEIYPQAKLEEDFLDHHFENFWQLYPRKVEKIAARKAFSKAVQVAGLDTVMAGLVRLAHDPNLPPKNFIPYPASWLNAGGWTNEPYPARELSPEEKAAKLAEERKKKSNSELKNTQKLLENQKQAERYAAPPPKCIHGNSLISCLPCLRSMS